MPLGQHIICSLEDNRVIAPTAAERLIVMRIIFRLALHVRLLAAHLVDSHLHLEFAEPYRVSMAITQHIESAIKQRLDLEVGFAPAYPQPIRDQRHLFNAFDYILRQQSRHGLSWDPFLESSNLPDLLGMRICGAYTAEHVKRLLPRVTPTSLLRYFDLASLDAPSAPLAVLKKAACAAAGIPTLSSRSQEAQEAKIAAIEVGRGHARTSQLADSLSLHRRTIERLRDRSADPALVRAIRGQLALRHALDLEASRNRDVFTGGVDQAPPTTAQRREPTPNHPRASA